MFLAASPVTSATEHEFGDLNINVAAEASSAAMATDYQITVADTELTLTRLTAAYQGTLSNSFVADLDNDGAFEVVVTFSFANGHDTGVHLYSWTGHLLEPRKVAELNAAQVVGYRGNDEFAVANGELVRIFQLYEEVDGEWQPTAGQRRLRYSVDGGKWLGE